MHTHTALFNAHLFIVQEMSSATITQNGLPHTSHQAVAPGNMTTTSTDSAHALPIRQQQPVMNGGQHPAPPLPHPQAAPPTMPQRPPPAAAGQPSGGVVRQQSLPSTTPSGQTQGTGGGVGGVEPQNFDVCMQLIK